MTIESKAVRYGVANEDLRSREKLTLIVLASFADEEGWLLESYPTLCKAAQATEATLRDSLKRLKRLGLVEDYGSLKVGMNRRIAVERLEAV